MDGESSMTANELLRLPRGYGKRYELIRGGLIERPASGNAKAAVVAMAATVLGTFVYPRNYGEVAAGDPGYLLEVAPDTVRSTDVAWIAPGRIPEGTTGYPNLAPDLIVEVKSYTDGCFALRRKVEMWLSFGTRQVWVADPDTTIITVYRPDAEPIELGEDDTIDGGDLLPDSTAPVWSLFRWQR